MNAARYEVYRRAVAATAAVDLSRAEREILRNAAEGMLLSRSAASEELRELDMAVSVVLADVVAGRRLDADDAERLKDLIDACGPAGVLAAAA